MGGGQESLNKIESNILERNTRSPRIPKNYNIEQENKSRRGYRKKKLQFKSTKIEVSESDTI